MNPSKDSNCCNYIQFNLGLADFIFNWNYLLIIPFEMTNLQIVLLLDKTQQYNVMVNAKCIRMHCKSMTFWITSNLYAQNVDAKKKLRDSSSSSIGGEGSS